ncbi:GTPase-activating protein and VPS9 domain-containing protein 1 [Trichinella nelsoni]|uniref:Receptor-mediated endocytosis protein 6 n=1 Tax=Trichinella nelsoni TaxID=6336 RepID=A0A0V0RGW0_9BILA|nr:GTPase-activating protein and VPS9 domain-containing protein 1 [Trichinella nelsoni]
MRYQNQLVDLCYRLRDEKLLVNADIDLILRLNTEVEEQILELVKICWIHCHQHRTLSKLLQSHPDATVQNACSQLCQLENAHFSDSKKQLANNETTITEILRLLLNSSKLVATVLHFFECVEPNLADELCFTFFCSVYGSCQFVNDEKCLYAVLCDLMRLQFSHCEGENFRRMLRRGSGAFCKMYRLATGSLFSVSLFLASALYQPIMQLISQNEQLLEIDPTKAAMRFSATEKLANWGLEGSSQYKENIANYRKIIIQRLVLVSNNFIQSIRDSLHCFPVPLAWLLRQLHFFLSDCLKLTTSECDQICTELIFSYIICPAIANPEAFGILSDTPVSSVARFNLMQVGQILQALAVCPWDRLDSKLNDLYSQFDTNSVHMLYRAILSDTVSIPLHRSNLDDIYTMEQQQQPSSPPALFSSTTTTTAASLLSAPTGYPDVFLFAISDPQEPVGLFGEEKFLSMMRQMKYGREESSCNAKRTRFMLAVDSDSLGANSDQLDEVASDEQRSDCSSAGQLTDHADMSALNDNFSDVDAVPMSANVSGRGSPSISGRDTPSSVPADQNDNAFEVSSQSPCGSGDMRQKTSCCSLPLPTMKANAMEERFGKFAMMPTRNRECHRDETHSMVSDSWSTDVLASDSEFGGDVQQSQLPLSSAWLPDIVPCPAPQAPRLDLISEKAQHLHTSASVGDHSDTWSVEASDSENDPNQRLRDIENDVFQSVSGVGENSRHILKSPVSDDGDSVSEQGLPCACQSTKPVHRQSSGSSLYSEIPDEGSSCGAGPSSSSLSSGAYLQHRPKQQQQRTWKTVPVQELSSSFRPYSNATSSNSNHKSCPGVADGNYPSVCFRAGGDKVDELDREEVSVVFHNESTAMPSGSSSSVVRTTPTAAAGCGNSSNNLRTNFATTVAKKLSPHVNRVIGLRGSSFSSPSIAATTATAATTTTTTTTLTTNADLAAPFSSIAGREGLFRGFRGLKPLRGRTPARNVTNKLLGNGESAAGSSSVQGESACDSADGAPFASRDYAAETGDQILDKYRCMALRNDDEPGGPTTTTTTTPLEPLVQMDEDTARPYYDSNNLTECQAFVDLKRKLRLILSTVDVDTLPVVTFRLSQTCSSLQQVKEHDELKQFLRVQLAETLISERMSLCVQIEDALRTLSYFDSKGLFHQTVQRLGDLITPTHKSLAIPTEYIAECPWPSAQAEILKINVYKSAGDKVKCVRRCCETIMHLLRASNAQTPSADDMVPLVVYVLIKANPEALLSTIQYVNGFYSGRMEGEEAYCWTQFCSAVEYIKMLVDDGL